LVRQEERLLDKVKDTLAKTPVASYSSYDKQLINLRDAMAEERLPDDRAMMMDQMDRLAAISTARSKYAPGQLDPASPYFAHLGLVTDQGERRDIMLGRQTFIKGDVRIVDWRNAPISKVFYRYNESDHFLEEIAERQMAGQVKERRMVTIVGGRLVRVASPRGIFLKTSKGWQDISSQATSLEGGAGSATRPDTATPLLGAAGASAGEWREHRADKHLPEIAGLLDRHQFDLLTRDHDTLLVVAGGAGSGKTTVGLHRLAYLTFKDPERFRPNRMQVLVFGTALARYISWVLPALGVEGVVVKTLKNWSLGQLHKHFPSLPRRTSPNTPASVVRFKTHRIMIPMLNEAAGRAACTQPADLFDELFTDRGWISRGIAKYARGAFTKSEIEEIHRWCTNQQFRRFDGGRADDDEQPCYDDEDRMILLRLYQLLHGRLRFTKRRALSYSHLMVDESQDFSPLELLVLMQTVRNNSITLAGDPAQKISANDFSNWSEVLELIDHDHLKVAPLKVSYRSTRQIMELANAVLGPFAPDEPLETIRQGDPVELLRFGGQGEAMTFLSDALMDLHRREPTASVAVLTRNADQADQAHSALRRTDILNLSRVSDQEFSFGPGVEVTDIAQTKGLEFDYVVLLNVDEKSYPLTPSARHLLHVGATRAIHQLWLLYWKKKCPLLPKQLKPRVAG